MLYFSQTSIACNLTKKEPDKSGGTNARQKSLVPVLIFSEQHSIGLPPPPMVPTHYLLGTAGQHHAGQGDADGQLAGLHSAEWNADG